MGGTDTSVTRSKVTSKHARRAGLCSRSSHSRRQPPTGRHFPSASCGPTHLSSLRQRQNSHCPRFTDGKTEARRGEVTWSEGHSRQGRELEPGQSGYRL